MTVHRLDRIGETEYGPHARTRRPADDGRADRGGPVRPSGACHWIGRRTVTRMPVGHQPATPQARQLDVLWAPHPDVPSLCPAALHRWVWRHHRLCDRARWLDSMTGSFVELGTGPRSDSISAFVPPSLGRCSAFANLRSCPFRPGRLAIVTARFDAPVARTCRYLRPPARPWLSKKDAIAECSADLVVMSIAPAAPETDIVAAAVKDPALGRSGPLPLLIFVGVLLLAAHWFPRRGTAGRIAPGPGGVEASSLTRSFRPPPVPLDLRKSPTQGTIASRRDGRASGSSRSSEWRRTTPTGTPCSTGRTYSFCRDPARGWPENPSLSSPTIGVR